MIVRIIHFLRIVWRRQRVQIVWRRQRVQTFSGFYYLTPRLTWCEAWMITGPVVRNRPDRVDPGLDH